MRALLFILAFTATGLAQPNGTVPYRVKQKDTLEMIAAELYGDRDLASVIVVENKLKDRKLRAGERLRIPVPRAVVTDKGDTFPGLAQEYLGDERRGAWLADFNEHDAADIPAIGTLVKLPAQITHIAAADETLAKVSNAYYGDGKHAELLRRYNNLEKPSIDKGDAIVVPLIQIELRKLTASNGDAAAKERSEAHAKLQGDAVMALPFARTAWLQGDFATVQKRLGPFADKLDFLDTPTAVEVGLLLGRTQVAFDNPDQAIKTFTGVLARKKAQVLSPYAESPKVIEAWKRANGQLRL